MIQVAAAILAGIMMAGAALRGLRPGAKRLERAYSAATGGWSALGAAIYYPAVYGRFAPIGLVHNHFLVTVFGFGLILLGIYGALLMMGDR